MTIHPSSHLQKGATLIAVFWIMAVMGLALVATVKISRYQSDIAAVQMNGIEARQFAEMGINLATSPQVEEWDPILNQSFENESGFEVKIESEGGRFNLNFILFQRDKLLLREIFKSWGLHDADADAVVDALIDWVDVSDDITGNGAESDYYESQGFVNRPFNRPFYDLDEARLVRGMDLVESANPRWQQWFTVWSDGGLDVEEASAEFLAIATRKSIEYTQPLVDFVNGPDGLANTGDEEPLTVPDVLQDLGIDPSTGDGAVIAKRLVSNDPVKRIESIGYAGSVRRKIVLVVKNRSNNPTILTRQEVPIR